jgi:hypothetical protein
VTYEIISIENGDVLSRVSDGDTAAEAFISYVETHRPAQPGIEQRVALIEIGDDEERRGEFLMYEDLVERVRPAAHA